MEYKGTELILDNFRGVLKDFSVDVQDIVRSAILDNVDISPFIVICKDNPYKLDQIRLAMKEGLGARFFSVSGDVLYRIRRMKRNGINISQIESQLRNKLSDEYLEYMLKWVEDGINISKLDIATIPKDILETFDYGLRNGFDMSIFNNYHQYSKDVGNIIHGYPYTPEYIKLCLQIIKNGKPVTFLLSGEWEIPCINKLSKLSSMDNAKWNRLVENIDKNTSARRIVLLGNLLKVGVNIVPLQEKVREKYVYSDGCLKVVWDSYIANLDLNTILKGRTVEEMKQIKSELELKKKRTVSGRIRKN